jgi:hypothetical protein
MPGDALTDDSQESAEASTCEEGRNSFEGGRFFRAIDWLSFGIATLAAFVVYLATIAPEVNLEDGGSFVTGAAYAGVPDPPGYPLWTLYSWLWTKLLPCSNDVGRQFGWLYFVFIPLPFCFWRKLRPEARRWMMGLIASFFCMGPMMVAMLNPTPERQTDRLAQQYFSALYVILAIWAGLGLMFVAAIITSPAAHLETKECLS